MFYVIMPSSKSRQALVSHLAGLGILAVFDYLPLHLSPMGLRFGGGEGDGPSREISRIACCVFCFSPE
jgi:dTDP-4-amino-4,6-dideoxygalactose transaminase